MFKTNTGGKMFSKLAQTFKEQGSQLALRKQFFVPSFAIYQGENTYLLVVNPIPTKLMVIDTLKMDQASKNFKFCTIDLQKNGKIQDYDDYVAHGNTLAVKINETVRLWRINIECDEEPELTRYSMKEVKMCSMLIAHSY
jgi:hypothetical protein